MENPENTSTAWQHHRHAILLIPVARNVISGLLLRMIRLNGGGGGVQPVVRLLHVLSSGKV